MIRHSYNWFWPIYFIFYLLYYQKWPNFVPNWAVSEAGALKVISSLTCAGKAENETNGPKPVAPVSNETYFPNTSDLADYRYLARKKLGDF